MYVRMCICICICASVYKYIILNALGVKSNYMTTESALCGLSFSISNSIPMHVV